MTAEELIRAIRTSVADHKSLKDLTGRYLYVVIAPPTACRGERAQIIHDLVADWLTDGDAYTRASTGDAFLALLCLTEMAAARKSIADPTANPAQAALEALAAAGYVGATEAELIEIFKQWESGRAPPR